jgi:hypothetical protein
MRTTLKVLIRLAVGVVVLASCGTLRAQAPEPPDLAVMLAEAIRLGAPEYRETSNPVLVREHTGVLRGTTVVPRTDGLSEQLGTQLGLGVRSERGLRSCDDAGRRCALVDTDFAVWAYAKSWSADSALIEVVKERSAPVGQSYGESATVLVERDDAGVWRAVRVTGVGVGD